MRFLTLAAGLMLAMPSVDAQPRIAIAQFTHESNSFNPAKTTYQDFNQRPLQPLGRLLVEWRKNNDDLSGYLDGAEKHGFDVYPILFANAVPKGPLTNDAYEKIVAEILRRLKAAPKLDGLLVALHGAMVTESIPHADLETTRRLREALGPKFPIIVTHDFHANVHPDMAKYVTALITYKEVPHLDPRQRGIQAAGIMSGVVAGKLKPTVAIAKPPMMLNIVFHNTSRAPMKPIVDESRRLETNPKILACSVPGGYQYADVPYMGPSVVVRRGQVAHLAIGIVQVRLGQSEQLLLQRDRLEDELPPVQGLRIPAPVPQLSAKPIPQTEQPGHNHKTGKFTLRRKTIGKRMAAKLREVTAQVRRRLHRSIGDTGDWLRSVVRGYFQYHAIPGNESRLWGFRKDVLRIWLRALRRRSQRSRRTWDHRSKLTYYK